MIDQIGTSELIDIAVLAVCVLMGIAGFWRGVVKEALVAASLVIGYVVALEWGQRWGTWIGEQTSLSLSEGRFAAIVATLALSAILLGYMGSTVAGPPPADLPGRFGGLIFGAANAVFALTIFINRAEVFVLSDARIARLQETRLTSRLSENIDWVVLGYAGVAGAVTLAGLNVRKRRAAFVPATGLPKQGASGFHLRRPSPLAPEAEKIDSTAPGAGWTDRSVYAQTTPLRRVQDPSQFTDRTIAADRSAPVAITSDPLSDTEVVRCVSCGERITEHDRFCPRCGRLLIP